MLEIIRIPVLNDNYVWLAHAPDGNTAVIDPAVSMPVIQELKKRHWQLTYILNTHHHNDHTGANLELKKTTKCTIIGPKADIDRIPGIDIALVDGDHFMLGKEKAQIFDVPGHTKGHIAFYFFNSNSLFCGDTLFALGCGRVFEGTMEQMWHSLSKFKKLPRQTNVYCAHEYTQANGIFALTVEPNNIKLKLRMDEVNNKRKNQIPTVPSTLGEEFDTNPFLRPDSTEIQETLSLMDAPLSEIFAKTRYLKDNFRG